MLSPMSYSSSALPFWEMECVVAGGDAVRVICSAARNCRLIMTLPWLEARCGNDKCI